VEGETFYLEGEVGKNNKERNGGSGPLRGMSEGKKLNRGKGKISMSELF